MLLVVRGWVETPGAFLVLDGFAELYFQTS